MSERPILFQGEMVRAILDGRKTQTRRAIKPVPTFNGGGAIFDGGDGQEDFVEPYWVFPETCKYGQPGDLLWVRETWGAVWPADEPVPLRQCEIEYRADLPPGCTDRPGEWPADQGNGPEVPKWRSSIHMPRWASRITLEVKGVRVERLHDITEDDARAEGAMWHDGGTYWHSGWRHDYSDVHADAYSSFARFWNKINGPGAWEANPWVWVISFERVKP
jgi:hypothetical protein